VHLTLCVCVGGGGGVPYGLQDCQQRNRSSSGTALLHTCVLHAALWALRQQLGRAAGRGQGTVGSDTQQRDPNVTEEGSLI